VNERNARSQERDKGRVDVARHLQQALFEERAHTAALNRLLVAGRARDGEAQLAPLGLRDAHQRGRRGPLQTLRDAPRSVEAAERAVVEPGVEPIANTNRCVPAVGGEARDKRKRVTLPTRRRSRRTSRCRLPPSLESTSDRSRSSTANPSLASRSLAPRRNASASTAFDRTPHNRIDVVVQQYAWH
jgi:hypothetical protein